MAQGDTTAGLAGSSRYAPARSVEALERRRMFAEAPFAVGGDPRIDSSDFRVTTFATGLSFPYGMQQLPDGSILVGTSEPAAAPGGGYFNSTGRLVRLVDADADGVADGPPAVLAQGLGGMLTDVRVAGRLVFVSAEGRSILVLRTGRAPADSYTFLGRIDLAFPAGPQPWDHGHYATAVRPTPGAGAGTYDLFFNVGSQHNAGTTPDDATVAVSGLVTGTVRGDSIYKVSVRDRGSGGAEFYDLTRIARGLRNAAGMAFHPQTGDLYFEDNGIDHPLGRSEPLSADELNRLRAADIGGEVEDFGFAHDYVEYRTGRRVGGGGIEPLVAFQPLPPNASESEGAVQIAFAPPAFPGAVNGGVFVGFHGQYGFSGVRNEENPLVYCDPATGEYFHFLSNELAVIGHPDGLLATSDSLLVADLAPGSDYVAAGTGVIYQITAVGHRTPTRVTARHVFYPLPASAPGSGSSFADGRIIDEGTRPVLPMQSASAANVTRDGRGILGIAIDVAGLPTNATPTAADFDFRAGTTGNPAAWPMLGTVPAVSVLRGGGAGGADRILLGWSAGAARNAWLRVTVKATARTGLATSDIFYFGNLAGDSDAALPAAVSAGDAVRTRARLHTSEPAELRRHDFNHDGVVNARDLAIVRGNQGAVLPAFSAPASPAAAGGVGLNGPIQPTRRPMPPARRSVWADLHPAPPAGLR